VFLLQYITSQLFRLLFDCSDYMDRFLDEMDNPLTEAQGSAISSSEVRYVAASCDGGSPVPAAVPPLSSLESTAAVSLQLSPAASAKDAGDDDRSQQSVTCASGKSIVGKNRCDSTGSSSTCCPNEGHRHEDELQTQCRSISESIASDGENLADGSGALVICEETTPEGGKVQENVDHLDDYKSAKCVLGVEESALTSQNGQTQALTLNSSQQDESNAAAVPIESCGPCLESDSVALSNIRVDADITSLPANVEAVSSSLFGTEVASTAGTSVDCSVSHADVSRSELADITGSLQAISGNLPVAGILSGVKDNIRHQLIRLFWHLPPYLLKVFRCHSR
jgi:hypothetical protein